MIAIQRDSEAFTYLERIFANPETHTVHLAVREDQEKVAVKRNEGMWTAPLNVVSPRELGILETDPDL